MKKQQIIAVDFDGTMVEHDFPRIGKPIPFAINVCKRLIRAGHKIMLWTMRSDNHTSWDKPENKDLFGNTLAEAIKYMRDNGIELWGINENPEQNWSSSNKQYANLYIDDAALGIPLIREIDGCCIDKPYVNWHIVDKMLIREGYYHRTFYKIGYPNNNNGVDIDNNNTLSHSRINERNDVIHLLQSKLKLHYEDVFLAKEHYTDNTELPTIGMALWYKGAGLYVDFELIVPQELLDDEDTDISFTIGNKHFSITCHN